MGDKAKENPGCVERFVCEMYKTGETMSGIPYILMSITNAAVSYTVAEQFNQSIEMEAITRSSRIGRSDGTGHHMECPLHWDNFTEHPGIFLTTSFDHPVVEH